MSLAQHSVCSQHNASCTLIALCSPHTLNAASRATVQELLTQLSKAKDPIVLAGDGKAFCAGGDLRIALATPHQRGYSVALEDLVLREIRAKRSYAVMSGVTMGFGAGMALAAHVRVATDTTKFAFPENSIGLVPDVGASYWLPRLQPPELGLYLALTGAQMTGADCYYSGLAQLWVPMAKLSHLVPLKTQSPELFFSSCHETPPRSACRILPHLPAIQRHFSQPSLLSIFSSLQNDSSSWAAETLKALTAACPLSLKVCWELQSLGKSRSFEECLMLEFNAMVQLTEVHPHNFEAGVGHLLGGPKPLWSPGKVESVNPQAVQAILSNQEAARLRL